MTSLYIHIPFCSSRCAYCDFVSYSKKENLIDAYLNYLSKEAKQYLNNYNPTIETIYIGGGTPSILNIEQLNKLYSIINIFPLNLKEFSIEANPESISEEKLKKYKDIGINRISIGLQTTKDSILKSLTRKYTYQTFIRKISLLQKYFDNINIDLMYGLPNQSFDDFVNDIENAKKLNPKHLSIYELHLSTENTLKRYLPNDEVRADMYEYLLNNLTPYEHYEISNWSLKKYMCLHNINYWKNDDYIGIGLSAGGHIGNMRYVNVKTFKEYFKALDQNKFPQGYYKDDVENNIKETIIMSLRLMQGLDINEFNNRFNKNFMKDYSSQIKESISLSLCEIKENHFRLTKKGIMLANRVFEYFI